MHVSSAFTAPGSAIASGLSNSSTSPVAARAPWFDGSGESKIAIVGQQSQFVPGDKLLHALHRVVLRRVVHNHDLAIFLREGFQARANRSRQSYRSR